MAKQRNLKTNVARLLDKAKINYELIPFSWDEKDMSAIHVAAELGEDIRQVYKTIVLRGNKTGPIVCVIPGDKEVDLKLAALVSGNKKCETLPLKELLFTTGYIRGGCCPIGMKKLFPVFLDNSAASFQNIFVSAGARGIQLKINPQDLKEASKGCFADLLNV